MKDLELVTNIQEADVRLEAESWHEPGLSPLTGPVLLGESVADKFPVNADQFNDLRAFLAGSHPILHIKAAFRTDHLGPTPTEWVSGQRSDWHVAAASLCRYLDNQDVRLVSYASENDGRVFVNLVKFKGSDRSAEKSKSSLRGHTDGSGLRLPGEQCNLTVPLSPDYVILIGLKNTELTPTRVALLGDVMRGLNPRQISLLHRPIFIAERQSSFCPASPLLDVPILATDSQFGTMTRFSHSKIVADPKRKEAFNALEEMKEIVSNSMLDLTLESGDIAIINNRTVIHGRGEPGESYSGDSRWLIRSYAMRKMIFDAQYNYEFDRVLQG